MAARKKAPADMRTVDLFTGKTREEEAADMQAEEEADFAGAANDARDRSDPRFEQEESAIRWLGLDNFASAGDDVRIAVSRKGTVLMLIDAAPDGSVRSMREQKLSPKQWDKLKQLVKEAP